MVNLEHFIRQKRIPDGLEKLTCDTFSEAEKRKKTEDWVNLQGVRQLQVKLT